MLLNNRCNVLNVINLLRYKTILYSIIAVVSEKIISIIYKGDEENRIIEEIENEIIYE